MFPTSVYWLQPPNTQTPCGFCQHERTHSHTHTHSIASVYACSGAFHVRRLRCYCYAVCFASRSYDCYYILYHSIDILNYIMFYQYYNTDIRMCAVEYSRCGRCEYHFSLPNLRLFPHVRARTKYVCFESLIYRPWCQCANSIGVVVADTFSWISLPSRLGRTVSVCVCVCLCARVYVCGTALRTTCHCFQKLVTEGVFVSVSNSIRVINVCEWKCVFMCFVFSVVAGQSLPIHYSHEHACDQISEIYIFFLYHLDSFFSHAVYLRLFSLNDILLSNTKNQPAMCNRHWFGGYLSISSSGRGQLNDGRVRFNDSFTAIANIARFYWRHTPSDIRTFSSLSERAKIYVRKVSLVLMEWS